MTSRGSDEAKRSSSELDHLGLIITRHNGLTDYHEVHAARLAGSRRGKKN